MSIYNENIFRNYDKDHGIANHHATVILTEQNLMLLQVRAQYIFITKLRKMNSVFLGRELRSVS